MAPENREIATLLTCHFKIADYESEVINMADDIKKEIVLKDGK
jgi:hypothetical protein